MRAQLTRAQVAARSALLDRADARLALLDETYLPLPRAAEMLGIRPERVGKLIERAEVVGVDIGVPGRRKWLVRRANLAAFLRSRSTAKGN